MKVALLEEIEEILHKKMFTPKHLFPLEHMESTSMVASFQFITIGKSNF